VVTVSTQFAEESHARSPGDLQKEIKETKGCRDVAQDNSPEDNKRVKKKRRNEMGCGEPLVSGEERHNMEGKEGNSAGKGVREREPQWRAGYVVTKLRYWSGAPRRFGLERRMAGGDL